MQDSPGERFYLGVDVGTGSARAGIFDAAGTLRGAAACDIQIWRPKADFVEQSSDDIWQAVCGAVVQALQVARLEPSRVRGVGFDATCSLVVLDSENRPVAVSPDGCDAQNVIVWMDHRALDEARRITDTGHEVLKYVGGRISPEMQTPKLLWLKEHAPGMWRRAARFLDLPDFLVYRATGRDVRSLCSTVCKWTYLAHRDDVDGGWIDSYFRQAGLGDLVDEGYRRIGKCVRPVGEAVGEGLAASSARELGLAPGTAVGVSVIDAHAGGLGMLGAPLDEMPATAEELETRLALIGGTSSCHMAVSREARYVPGVWGPYYSAMVPGMWLTEGGQSATGALIDHILFSHAQADGLREVASTRGTTVYALLNERLERLGASARFPATCTCCLTFTAIARLAPMPRCAASSPGYRWATPRTTWRCFTSRPCRRSRTARGTSSRR
jgi:FGGY-family pentulose kinase